MKFFKRIKFSGTHEEILPEDKANSEGFCTSLTIESEEKKLRNRMVDRNESLIMAVKEGNVMQAAVFAAQMEELEDILTEWKNIRTDVQQRDAKA